jgi:hypothetical protein
MIRLLLITATLGAGCGHRAAPPDDAFYVGQLIPVLADNGLLADRMLHAAADLSEGSKSQAAGPRVAERWRDEIVPLAHHVHDQAALLQPPEPWVDRHSSLVAIWAARAQGYQLVLDGVSFADEARFKRGRALADQAKLDEESWFQDANTALQPSSLALDQYP